MLVTKDFVLVHVPKTGGTFLNGLVKEYCEVVYEKMHGRYPDLPERYRELPVIAFARDPMTWYPSWWAHMRDKGPASVNEWPYWRIYHEDFRTCLLRAFTVPELGSFDYYSDQFIGLTQGLREDQIGRFETLREDFVSFLDKCEVEAPGLREDVLIHPPVNTGSSEDLSALYDSKTEELVRGSWMALVYGYRFTSVPS
jgi:hypothetical protein